MQATNNLAIQGSNVVSTSGTTLQADGDIAITSATNTQNETHSKQVKKSGFGASGTSIGYSKSKLNQNVDSTSTTQMASTVGSVEGDVIIQAGKSYTQTASDVVAPQGDIDITAQKVDITSADNTAKQTTTTKYKQSGISLSISNPVINAIQTANQMKEAASNTSDGRMQALAAGTAALAGKNAYDAVSAGMAKSGANVAQQAGGVNISLSIGSSKSSSTSTQTSNTAQSSQVTAGQNVNITAAGAGEQSDITVIGSQIKAGNDASLKADDQVNLLAAQNTDTLNSKNKGSSASVGVSFGTDGLLFTAGASGSKGKANGTDTTWTETKVEAGNKASIASGTDTTLKGAQVKGKQVTANVGTSGQGNLNVESLQDTSTYKDKQQSVGARASVGYGRWGASANVSDSKTNSNYASVNEQTGIYAGDNGFQVNVNGNTDLKGAIIASTDKAIQDNKNSLTTNTLTTSNIENKAEYEGKASRFGAGVGTTKQADGMYRNAPTASAGFGKESDKASSTTVSAVSGAAVAITDNAKQQTTTGKDVATTVATLNRDVKVNEEGKAVDSQGNATAGTLKQIFDQDKVQRELNAQVQITQAFSQLAPKAVGDFATNKINEISLKLKAAEALNDQSQINTLKAELSKWGEGGLYRVGLHTFIGGLAGNVNGAIGTAGSQVAIPAIIDGINKLDVPLELKETLLVGISTSVGALVGNAGAAAGALNAAVNNCNAHECLTQKWDKSSAGYHHYQVESPKLCNVVEAGCMEAVQHELLSNSAPGQIKPAIVGQVVAQSLTGGNGITQYAPSANMIVNGTNDNHIFNDGYVVRTINVDISGNVTIVTQGEGVNTSTIPGFSPGTMAKLNSALGYAIFYDRGIQNLSNVKDALNPQVP